MGNYINVISQSFYGNRTGTMVNVDDICGFIHGWIGELPNGDKRPPFESDLKSINITKDIVILYDGIRETKARNKKYGKSKPTAIIPEHNITLYSRCIACRVDEGGNYLSIMPEDYKVICKYFTE